MVLQRSARSDLGRRPWCRHWTERGAATVPVLVGAVALSLVGAAGLGRAAAVTASVARVQSIADLTACAGVVGGAPAAGRIAAANGAVVESFHVDGAVVSVDVARVGVVRSATARPARGDRGSAAVPDGAG